MKNKIKVVHIVKDLKINGISTVVMNYMEKLDKKKYDITIVAGNPIADKNRDECIKNGIHLIETPSKTNDGAFKYYKKLYKILKHNSYDIIHIHGNSRTITIELFIAALCGIKNRVAHCHNTQCNNKIVHIIFKPIFDRLYSVGVACSDDAGKWMFKNRKFSVLQNGFELEKFKFNSNVRDEQRKKLQLPNDAIVIGHVGLFNNQKNHPFILKVFKKIYEQNKNYYLLLVGNGPDKEKIEKEINESLYKDNVIVYGVSSEVYKLYSAMDIFLFPSRFEGLGIVLLEAQISGLPCMVSSTVPKEVNLSEKYYSLSLDSDISEWVKVMSKITPYQDRLKCFENSNLKKYDINKNVREIEEIYDSLIKGVN